MYCTKCGECNDTDSKFCTKCGIKLSPISGKKKVEDILFIPEKKTHTLRNILLVIGVFIVIIIILGAISSSNTTTTSSTTNIETSTSGWQTFNSVEHGFKIDFPKYPDTERINPESSDSFTYSGTQYYTIANNDQDIYMAQAFDYDITPNNFDNKTGLEGGLNALARSEGYNITNSYFASFKGYDALEFIGGFDNNSYYLKGVVFVRDDLDKVKAFFLMALSKDYSNYINYYNRFINSFTLNY